MIEAAAHNWHPDSRLGGLAALCDHPPVVRMGTYALVCVMLGACQATSVDFADPPENKSIGELAYAIALSNAGHASVCSEALQASLRADQSLLVSGVDETLPSDVLDDLPALMSSSVLPALDDGQLEALIDASAAALGTLVDDEIDPERRGLRAVSQLLDSSRLLQDQHLIELARVVLIDPNFAPAVHSLAALQATDDPLLENQTLLRTLLSGVAEVLATQEPTSKCTGLDASDAARRLLDTSGFAAVPVAGGPAWVAEVDGEGNALPAFESSVSASAPFGFGDAYDGQGRRLGDDGELYYRYYDAKRTALAHGFRLAGEAAEAGVFFNAMQVLDASLGAQEACESSSDSCVSYRANGQGLHRLLFTLLEVAKYDKPVLLLQRWRDLVLDNPVLAEDVLVSVGRVIKALETTDVEVEGEELFTLSKALLPVLADVFQIEASNGASMPRLLMQLVSDLGASARDFPDELALSIEHTTLIKADECSAEEPSPASPKVDFSRRRFFFDNGALVDNRSSIERSIELLHAADCGSVPFTGGKSVSHVIVDLMSRLAPETVCNLIDDLLGLLGVTGSVGEAVVNSALFVVGCGGDDDVNARDLFALDDLAKSGALDFYLPVAKSFREEGQLPALIAVFSVLAQDLLGDEDNSSNTASALRPMLPVLAEVLRSGAMEPFFDLNAQLVGAGGAEGSLADVLIDSIERLLEDRLVIATVNGNAPTSLATELLLALEEVSAQVEVADASNEFDQLTSHLTSYLTRTVNVDDRLQLRDSSVVPLLVSSLEFLTEAADLSSEQYQCYLAEYQQELQGWIESPALASLLRVALTAKQQGLAQPIEDFAKGLLRPVRGDVAIAPFRELLRMTAGLVQSPSDFDGGRDLANAASTMLNPDVVGTGLLTSLDALLLADDNEVLMRMLSGALGPGNTPGRAAPLRRLYEVAENYALVDEENACVLGDATTPSPEELEESIKSTVRFLRDSDSLLHVILDVLRKRRAP
tara:strand:+ start:19432 stop:22401 length:2970 start_codon:yes stop_codon:yes gene_type:complete